MNARKHHQDSVRCRRTFDAALSDLNLSLRVLKFYLKLEKSKKSENQTIMMKKISSLYKELCRSFYEHIARWYLLQLQEGNLDPRMHRQMENSYLQKQAA